MSRTPHAANGSQQGQRSAFDVLMSASKALRSSPGSGSKRKTSTGSRTASGKRAAAPPRPLHAAASAPAALATPSSSTAPSQPYSDTEQHSLTALQQQEEEASQQHSEQSDVSERQRQRGSSEPQEQQQQQEEEKQQQQQEQQHTEPPDPMPDSMQEHIPGSETQEQDQQHGEKEEEEQQQHFCSEETPTAAAAPEAAIAAAQSAGAKAEARAAFMRALSGPARPARQAFTHLLVIDLEATCNESRSLHPIEIIELSCVVLETATAATVGEFQSYVRPTEHPVLDPFCIELTGISQPQVNSAPLLAEALSSFDGWLRGLGVPLATSAPACWTSWDLEVALSMEARWRGLKVPSYLCRWIDLKKSYSRHYRRTANLRRSVEAAGLTWEGRAHSGIDDARNEARLAAHMMRRGVRFEIAGAFPQDAPHRQREGVSGEGAGAAAAAGQAGHRAGGALGRAEGEGERTGAGSGGSGVGAAAAASSGAGTSGGGGSAPKRQRQALLAPLRPLTPPRHTTLPASGWATASAASRPRGV